MSANLANSATLAADATFQRRVQAAVVERALTVAAETTGDYATRTPRTKLAAAAVADAAAYASLFTRLVADDAAVSAAADPAAVTDADVRRIVGQMWSSVAAALPNLP